eukprot:g20083.t1
MDRGLSGWINGFIGVLIFSGSLPATRAAVGGFDPLFLTVARGAIAGLLALCLLLLFRQKRPTAREIVSLVVIALGVVVGFPLLTAVALQHISSAHSIVFIGLLPLATAIFGVIRGGERPQPAFWIFAVLGSLLVTGFALVQGGTAASLGLSFGDWLMLAAIVACGLGYAEGAALSRRLGGWQVICWALTLSLPVMLVSALALMPASFAGIGAPAFAGLAYVSLFSMLIGFIFWYRGLAQGGTASVGQLQLLQPFFGLALASLLLGETVTPAMFAVTLGVILCPLNEVGPWPFPLRTGRTAMKVLLLAAAVALAATAKGYGMDGLSQFQWKNRVLIVFGASGERKAVEQLERLANQTAELGDRDMVVLQVEGDRVRAIHGSASGLDARGLRAEADAEDAAFQVVLVGKDGGVKLRSRDADPAAPRNQNRLLVVREGRIPIWDSPIRPCRSFTVFHFDNSYARLPDRFYASVYPEPVEGPTLLKFNEGLAQELGIEADFSDPVRLAAILAGNVVPQGAMPIAMAYAGHQFGNFVPQLGDGRAILLGEVIDKNGLRRDIQLKGAGPTPFSRRGDGRAALGPVLREYIVSEAMHALGIPATRALAAVATGEQVYRETPEQGAVFVRVAASHVRVGTFQFFAARGDTEGVRVLADYVIERHYPELKGADRPYLALLEAVAARQADLIARWLGVGFIHGVMNTDNMTISGETIDFGPCAFLDEYDQMKVFSSIDQMGRYAYRNQPGIGQWNIARLAECLLPLIDADEEKAVEAANGALKTFGERFQSRWLSVFLAKIGVNAQAEGDADLVQGLLTAMQEAQADFTLTFRALADAAQGRDEGFLGQFSEPGKAIEWLAAWRVRLAQDGEDGAARAAAMRRINPAIIPRNHRIQEAIAAANYGDLSFFNRLVEALARPFEERDEFAGYRAGLGEIGNGAFDRGGDIGGQGQERARRLGLRQAEQVGGGIDDAQASMGLEQAPERLEQRVQPVCLDLVSTDGGARQGQRLFRKQAADDAVPAIGTGEQRPAAFPVAAIADRKVARRPASKAGKLASEVQILRQRHLHRLDGLDLGEAADQVVAEAEMGGGRVVVDRKRKVADGGDGCVVTEDFLFGEGRIGNGRKQKRIGARIGCVPRQGFHLVGAERADADHERNLAVEAFDSRFGGAPALLARQIERKDR